MQIAHIRRTACFVSILLLLSSTASGQAVAEKVEEGSTKVVEKSKKTSAKVVCKQTTLAKGGLELSVVKQWKDVPPKSRILEREFAVQGAKGEGQNARLTVMRSGGTVEQNVERWFTQFTQPDKKATKDVAKVASKKFNGQDVTIVDISGTYRERQGGGPFAGGKLIDRPDYRMLAGIVQTKEHGQYFFKLIGPAKTVKSAEKSFSKMLESVKAK